MNHKEDPLISEAKEYRKKINSIRQKFDFTKTVQNDMLQYTFLAKQAEYICELLFELQLSPFKPLYTAFKSMVEKPEFMEYYLLHKNEFGTIVPDEEKLNTHLPKKHEEGPELTQKLEKDN